MATSDDIFKNPGTKWSLEKFLESTSIRDIVPPKQAIVSISPSTTIAETIKLLSEHRILSVLVIDRQATEPSKMYLGFVDMFDILSFVISKYTEDKETEDHHHHLHMWTQNIETLSHKGREFATHAIKDCIDLSKLNPFCTVKADAKLPALFYEFQKGLHRLAIVDESGNVVNIVSQSNVIQFLAKNIHVHPSKILQATVDEIGWSNSSVVTVGTETRAIQAFNIMKNSKVSAVGIVDKAGILVANLSISDLRGLGQNNFKDLLLPVGEYFSKRVIPLALPPLSVKSSTPFETVLLKLAATKVHRLWVVDEMGRPTGLISLTDVNQFLDLRVYANQTTK